MTNAVSMIELERRIIEQVVRPALERVGFSIQRVSDAVVAWHKDLSGSHLLIYFADRQLFGEPASPQWVVMVVEDDPSPDAKVRTIFDLNLSGAIETAKMIESGVLLERAGRLLYGDHYAAPFAHALDMDKDLVRKMAAGKSNIRRSTWLTIAKLMQDRFANWSDVRVAVLEQAGEPFDGDR